MQNTWEDLFELFMEPSYGRFKPLCDKCVSTMRGIQNVFKPNNDYFMLKCDECKTDSKLGMFMFKPGFFRVRCEGCIHKSA